MVFNMAKRQRWLVSSWWCKKSTEESCLGFDLSLLVMLVWISLSKKCFLSFFSFSLQPYLCTPEGLYQHQWLQSLLLKWKTQNSALNCLWSWGIKRKESWVGTIALELVQSDFLYLCHLVWSKNEQQNPQNPTPRLISQWPHQEFESQTGGREESFGIIYVLKCSLHSVKQWIFKACC